MSNEKIRLKKSKSKLTIVDPVPASEKDFIVPAKAAFSLNAKPQNPKKLQKCNILLGILA